jgi:hypothetical protein
MNMRIVNLTSNLILADNAKIADSFFSRLKGLLGTKQLLPGEGLVIKPCNSVHTFGMNYAIDVVFTAADHRVVKTVPDLAPGKLALCGASSYVIELPAGTLASTATAVGDYLELIADQG